MLIQEETKLKKQRPHFVNLMGHKGAEKKLKRKKIITRARKKHQN